jgi:hypothetical protein
MRLRSAFRDILTQTQMPQILIDVADDPILVINNGPIPLRRRQLHLPVARLLLPAPETLDRRDCRRTYRPTVVV